MALLTDSCCPISAAACNMFFSGTDCMFFVLLFKSSVKEDSPSCWCLLISPFTNHWIPPTAVLSASLHEHWRLTMDWLMSTVEKDLGIEQQQQGPGPRPQEIVALVPTRWVTELRERRVIRCARFNSPSETEICTYLQCPQAKLPPGWTRVCIQGLRKSKLRYRYVRDQYDAQREFASKGSYVRTMQCVSQQNVRYCMCRSLLLWSCVHLNV